jgi:hypothetical protein
MSHGVAGNDWESLKRKENCCDKLRHGGLSHLGRSQPRLGFQIRKRPIERRPFREPFQQADAVVFAAVTFNKFSYRRFAFFVCELLSFYHRLSLLCGAHRGFEFLHVLAVGFNVFE